MSLQSGQIRTLSMCHKTFNGDAYLGTDLTQI